MCQHPPQRRHRKSSDMPISGLLKGTRLWPTGRSSVMDWKWEVKGKQEGKMCLQSLTQRFASYSAKAVRVRSLWKNNLHFEQRVQTAVSCAWWSSAFCMNSRVHILSSLETKLMGLNRSMSQFGMRTSSASGHNSIKITVVDEFVLINTRMRWNDDYLGGFSVWLGKLNHFNTSCNTKGNSKRNLFRISPKFQSVSAGLNFFSKACFFSLCSCLIGWFSFDRIKAAVFWLGYASFQRLKVVRFWEL